MASAIIHMSVTQEINKILKRNNRDIMIGSIAPDISKHLGRNKLKSHFQDCIEDNIPNLEKFLNEYKNNLNDDFVLGYYIHLYTDYIWFKYFLPDFVKKDFIYKLDGSKLNVSEEEKIDYIYNDYTNINTKLIDEYELNLDIFYLNIDYEFKNIIKEIPMDEIQIIIDKTGIIIENATKTKAYIFDIDEIKKFIDISVNAILDNLKEIDII